MTQFTNAVEKRRGLIALDKWSKQIKHIHYNNYIEEVTFRDGSKELTDIRTEEVIYIPREKRRRELINSKPFQWFLDKIKFYGDRNERRT
tara:strand:- start:2663 stop:2932 length:270 start_codon:yes stop_codon:yes gene_type:complete